MRFIRGAIIASWKLYPIPRLGDLKYSRLWQFLTVSEETDISVKAILLCTVGRHQETGVHQQANVRYRFVSIISHFLQVIRQASVFQALNFLQKQTSRFTYTVCHTFIKWWKSTLLWVVSIFTWIIPFLNLTNSYKNIQGR